MLHAMCLSLSVPLSLAVCCCATARAADDLPQVIEPNDKTGSSSAVVVGDVPLVHTAQVMAGGNKDQEAEAQVSGVLDTWASAS